MFFEAIALIEPKLCFNHWKVLYKLCVFDVDRNSKMPTTAGHSFYIGPIGSFYNQVNDTGSWGPLVYCSFVFDVDFSMHSLSKSLSETCITLLCNLNTVFDIKKGIIQKQGMGRPRTMRNWRFQVHCRALRSVICAPCKFWIIILLFHVSIKVVFYFVLWCCHCLHSSLISL